MVDHRARAANTSGSYPRQNQIHAHVLAMSSLFLAFSHAVQKFLKESRAQVLPVLQKCLFQTSFDKGPCWVWTSQPVGQSASRVERQHHEVLRGLQLVLQPQVQRLHVVHTHLETRARCAPSRQPRNSETMMMRHQVRICWCRRVFEPVGPIT